MNIQLSHGIQTKITFHLNWLARNTGNLNSCFVKQKFLFCNLDKFFTSQNEPTRKGMLNIGTPNHPNQNFHHENHHVGVVQMPWITIHATSRMAIPGKSGDVPEEFLHSHIFHSKFFSMRILKIP